MRKIQKIKYHEITGVKIRIKKRRARNMRTPLTVNFEHVFKLFFY